MSRICAIVAWLLLVGWLPAMLHCEIEAVWAMSFGGDCGEWHEQRPTDAHAHHDHPVMDDAALILHGGGQKVYPQTIELPEREAVVCPARFEVLEPRPPVGGAPPHLAVIWQFLYRAAAPAHAPDAQA